MVIVGASSPGGRDGDAGARELRRARIVDAMTDVVAERGFAGATVALVCARAKVTQGEFYALFAGVEECFEAVMDRAERRSTALILGAFVQEDDWRAGIRRALATLLQFFEVEPGLARVELVEILAAGSWALRRRERNVANLRDAIVAWWTNSELALAGEPPPLAAEGVMASLLGVIQGHLVGEQRDRPLLGLLGPLTGIALGPFLEPAEVAREVELAEVQARKILAARDPSAGAQAAGSGEDAERGVSVRDPVGEAFARKRVGDEIEERLHAVRIPALLRNPNARRARRCLAFLDEQGRQGHDPSNGEIAVEVGVAHKSQISRLLASLLAEGLVTKTSQGVGKRNGWRLTPEGELVLRALRMRGGKGKG